MDKRTIWWLHFVHLYQKPVLFCRQATQNLLATTFMGGLAGVVVSMDEKGGKTVCSGVGV